MNKQQDKVGKRPDEARTAAGLIGLPFPSNDLDIAPRLQAWENPALSAAFVRGIIRARQRRGKYLKTSLFADPAWDILLVLLYSELRQVRTPISVVCERAGVPPTTALRWLKALENEELIVRQDDPLDGRRVFIALTLKASEALRDYFEDPENRSAI